MPLVVVPASLLAAVCARLVLQGLATQSNQSCHFLSQTTRNNCGQQPKLGQHVSGILGAVSNQEHAGLLPLRLELPQPAAGLQALEISAIIPEWLTHETCMSLPAGIQVIVCRGSSSWAPSGHLPCFFLVVLENHLLQAECTGLVPWVSSLHAACVRQNHRTKVAGCTGSLPWEQSLKVAETGYCMLVDASCAQ